MHTKLMTFLDSRHEMTSSPQLYPLNLVSHAYIYSMHIGKMTPKNMATKRHDSYIPLQNQTSATLKHTQYTNTTT